ncbi:MAG: hypothetical protein SH847_06010 [Roseiflexaceae bacterium]|nr:hypothetical protein [Roseiflexaceae bacterium]
MTRIIGIHEYELKPGVTESEFEQAMKILLDLPIYPGWRVSLIKSDRGTRSGKYGLLFEIESVEARARIVTDDGETEESKQFDASHPETALAYANVLSLVVDPYPWSDYQVL